MNLRQFLQRHPPTYRRYIKVILRDHLNLSDTSLLLPETLSEKITHSKELEKKIDALLSGTPLSRILGYKEFWSLKFHLSKDTLDPRPDSETLIEAVLKESPDTTHPLRILDLGTGTGCIIISLLREYPNAIGVAVDISQSALSTTQKNATLHGVHERLTTYKGSWLQALPQHIEKFDLIVANPPYISEKAYAALARNVIDYDPKRALTPGISGLEAYNAIIPTSLPFLKAKGLLVLEIGFDQTDQVSDILLSSGFHPPHLYKDLSSKDRCLVTTIA